MKRYLFIQLQLIAFFSGFLISDCARAATRDYVHPNWCLPSFPYGMIVMASDGKSVLVGQGQRQTLSPMGAVELKGHTPREHERLNILVQYVGTKQIKGANGFMQDVDIWKQCHKMTNEPKLNQERVSNGVRYRSLSE